MSNSTEKSSIVDHATAMLQRGYEDFSRDKVIEVYVACHPHSFETEKGEDEGHWQGILIKKETEREFGKERAIHYTTGDVQPWVPKYEAQPRYDVDKHAEYDNIIYQWKKRNERRKKREKTTATYDERRDIFNVKRTDGFNFHDSVWLPDCGGDWWHMQKGTREPEYEIKTDLLAKMLPSFRNSLRDSGGYIYLGKFVGPNKLRDNTIQEIRKLQPTWDVKRLTASIDTGDIVSDEEKCYHETTECVYYIKIKCPPLVGGV